MKTIRFKTNINCSGCVETVKPFIEEIEGIKEWRVDTGKPEKILEVKAEKDITGELIEKVKAAGFQIEPYEPGIFKKLFKH